MRRLLHIPVFVEFRAFLLAIVHAKNSRRIAGNVKFHKIARIRDHIAVFVHNRAFHIRKAAAVGRQDGLVCFCLNGIRRAGSAHAV